VNSDRILRDGDEMDGYGDEGSMGVPQRVSGVGPPDGADEVHIASTCAGAEQ